MAQKRHIVMVDDNADILQTMSDYLDLMSDDFDLELTMTTFRSGQSFMASLLRGNFPSIDLLLLDFDMPGMNGPEVARVARQKGQTDTVVVMMSAFNDPGRHKEARANGVNAYCSKIMTSEVDQRVKTFLGIAQSGKLPATPSDWLTVFETIGE